jgi:ABC-type methionine transport system ATPase subunit
VVTRTLRLIYPPSLANEPILNHLIRRFELTVNMRQAQITLQEGWLEVEVSGEEEEIACATSWLEQKGVEVESVG